MIRRNMTRLGLLSLLAVAGVLSLASVTHAGKFNKVLNVGDTAPNWQGLLGADGKTYALGDYKDKKAIVLVFTCNHCPVAVACEDRIVELQKDYADKGVQVVAISVSDFDEDSMAKMTERAQEKGFNFPYVQDLTKKVGRDYGAAVTPHFFVLDADRKVAYMGLMDDEPLDPAAIKKPYVREALDAVLAGKAPATTETKQQGCSIKY